MGKSTVSAKCRHCGLFRSPVDEGPCPRCGKAGEKIAFVHLSGEITPEGTHRWVATKEYWQKNSFSIGAVVVIIVASSLPGVLFAGPVGLAVGLLLGLVGSIVGLKAFTKVREIRSGE